MPHATSLLKWAQECADRDAVRCQIFHTFPRYGHMLSNLPPVCTQSALSFEALCQSEAAHRHVLAELQRTARDARLKGFEFVKAVHLEARPWTVESGLLTPTFKNKRTELQKYYHKDITALYDTWNKVCMHAPPNSSLINNYMLFFFLSCSNSRADLRSAH